MSKADDKQIEEAIKRMERDYQLAKVEDSIDIDILIVDIEIVLKELKRLQEENNKLERANKTYINSLQNIVPVLLEDYIEKDKIRERIEERKFELQQEYKDFKDDIKLNILEELLEEK